MDCATKLNVAVLIVNSIAAIFAVIAAIIAVVVYRKSAKIQNRAIGFSLLESRIQLWKYFEHDKNQPSSVIKAALEGRDWQLEKFRLLFSEDLVKEYDSMVAEGKAIGKIESKIDSIERDMFPIPIDSNDNVNQPAFDLYSNIKGKRKSIFEGSASASELADFKELCKTSFQERDSNEYYSLVMQFIERRNALKKRHAEFIKKMEAEIKASINQ